MAFVRNLREIDKDEKALETYVNSGAIFYFDRTLTKIGNDYINEGTIPIPV